MTPLLLTLLSSTHAPLLIKTLQTIPPLCTSEESSTKSSSALDFATVRDVVFPRVAEVFTKTTVLGVKVAGLVCLGGLVSVLDKYTLQEKVVPLIAKIRTKEPSVLLSALNIFTLLSNRLTDPVVISTLILPQLWTFSAAPLLNEEQFNRFMGTIDTLSRIVREERGKELRAAAHTAQTTAPTTDPSDLSWEDLVRGGGQAASSSNSRANDFFMSGSLTPDEGKTSLHSNGVSNSSYNKHSKLILNKYSLRRRVNHLRLLCWLHLLARPCNQHNQPRTNIL